MRLLRCRVISDLAMSNHQSNNGQPTKVVGKPFRKVDARAKCTGQTKFADDIFLPRMLYCKILRSHLPHALIKNIDFSKARSLPGVAGIITGKDLPIPYGILPVSQDEHALCIDKVRFIGDPVAAVAAIDEDVAFDAMNLIEVEYERLNTISSIEEAILIEEPRIHEYGDEGNIHKKVSLEFGNVEEGFYCHRGRHPVLMHVKTGVKKDGAITGMHFQSFLDGGAYGSYGVASTFYTGALQTVTYDVPRYKFQGLRAFTNKPPCGPKRGHGTPQPRYGLEVHLDKIAEELRLDPAAMRRANLVKPNIVTANYLRIGSMGLGVCIDKVVAGSDWKNKFSWNGYAGVSSAAAETAAYRKGIGFACSSYICGAGLPIYWNNMPQSGVQLRLDRQGGVCVMCGSTDIGQGSDSILAYIVAEILGIDPFDIRVVTADTDLTPVDLGSYSSRVTLMTGNAAIQAAERARELLTIAVAEKLNVPIENISFADRRAFDVENPEIGMSFAEAVVLAESKFGTIGTVGSYTPPQSPGKYKGAGVGPSPAYSYSAAVAEVEVDVDTGIVN